MRSWAYFALPPLEYEDGAALFGHFYAHREWSELLRFKGGYLPLVQNALAWVAVRIDLRAAPYFLTWVPLGLAALGYAYLATRIGPVVIRAPRVRRLFPFLLLAIPLGQIHLLAHTDYSIHNAAFLLCSAVCLARLRLRWWAWAGLNLLVWTHPLTSLAAPFLLWDAWRSPSGRAWRLLTAANCAVHLLWGVEADAALTFTQLLSGLINAPRFLSFVAAWTTLGPAPIGWLQGVAPWAISAWGFLLLGGVAFAAVRARRFSGPAVRGALLLAGWATFTVAGRGVEVTLERMQFRYWFVPGLLMLVLGGGAAVVSNLHVRRVLPVVLTGWVVLLNLGPLDWYQPRHPENGVAVSELMVRLREREQRSGTWRGQLDAAEKQADWSITIDTR